MPDPVTPPADNPPAPVVNPPAANPPAPTLLSGVTPPPADKPAGDATPPADKPAGDVAPPAGAPAEYAEFKLPEGFSLDPGMKTDFTTLAKEMNLTQDQAQKLATLGSKLAEQQNAERDAAYVEVRESWVSEITNDPEYGGDKLPVTLERANRALRTFGSPELIQFFNESGFGDNPHLVRAFAKIDKATGESAALIGRKGGSPAGKTDAEILYPNQ